MKPLDCTHNPASPAKTQRTTMNNYEKSPVPGEGDYALQLNVQSEAQPPSDNNLLLLTSLKCRS